MSNLLLNYCVINKWKLEILHYLKNSIVEQYIRCLIHLGCCS